MKVDVYNAKRVVGVCAVKGEIFINKLCEICNSNKGVRNYKRSGVYICARHAYQLRTHGKILKRTTHDPNEITIKGDYALIHLYNKNCEEVARAVIDVDKVEDVKQYKWYLHSNGYVCNKTKKRVTYMHRLIAKAPNDKFVDHINMNKLDNRLDNLRLCNNGENMRNKEEMESNYSGFRGVRWNKEVRKWDVNIGYNKQNIQLGYYDLFKDAVDARLDGERKYYKEFAPQSDIISQNNTLITEEEILNKKVNQHN